MDNGPLPGGGALAVRAVTENDVLPVSQVTFTASAVYAELVPCTTEAMTRIEREGEQLTVPFTVTWVRSLDRLADLMNRPALYCPAAAVIDVFEPNAVAAAAMQTIATIAE